MVKIDQVIGTYLSIPPSSVNNLLINIYFWWFNTWHENGRIFNKYMNKNFFFELLLQRKLSFIRIYTQVTSQALWCGSRNVCAFKTSLKFRFLVQYFEKFLFGSDLLNTGFTIIEIGLFYDGEQLYAKVCRFLTFFTRWRCLLNEQQGNLLNFIECFSSCF